MPDSICGIDKQNVVSVNDSTDILNIQVSSTLSLQAMSSNTTDSLIYLVKTYAAPEKESVLIVCDNQWNIKNSKEFTLTDIIGEEFANKLAKYYSPLLIQAEIISSDSIKLSVADFILSDDEKKEIKAIVGIKEENAENKKDKTPLLSKLTNIASLLR